MATGVLSFLRGIDLTRFPLGSSEDDTSKLQDLHKVSYLDLWRHQGVSEFHEVIGKAPTFVQIVT